MSSRYERLIALGGDVVLVNAVFALLYSWGFRIRLLDETAIISGPKYIVSTLSITLFWVVLFYFFGLYRPPWEMGWVEECYALFKAVTLGVPLLLGISLVFGDPLSHTRGVVILYWFALLVVPGLFRSKMRLLGFIFPDLGMGWRRALIVGTTERAKRLLRRLEDYPQLRYQVVGILADDGGAPGSETAGIPVLGGYEDVRTAVEGSGAEELLIAIDSRSHQELLALMQACNGIRVKFKILPDLYDIVSGHVRTRRVEGFPLMELLTAPMSQRDMLLKRAMDIAISVLVLTLFSPVWFFVGLLIKTTSAGSMLHTQERVGRGGKVFTLYKFRSMIPNAEEATGPVWAAKNDHRITPIGRILRRTRVDEVPQLLNVLRGDMSLVGPRPERPFFVQKLKREIPIYSKRLSINPGITGWAQVMHKYDSCLDDVTEKVKFDLYYMENMSLQLDLKVLLKTFAVVWNGKGAH